MKNLTKKPIQVYLRPEQLDRLRAIAERQNLSLAELIRRSVDRLLADIPVEDDPLLEIIGLADGGPEDLAENHDVYLAATISRDNR